MLLLKEINSSTKLQVTCTKKFTTSYYWFCALFCSNHKACCSCCLLLCSLLSSLWYSPSRAVGVCIFIIHILQVRLENWLKVNALVSTSANWQWVLTWFSLITFSKTLSLTTWQSISICFVFSWKTGLELMCNAAYLSQNSRASLSCFTPISLRKYKIHTISHVATTMDLYSVSAKDLDTVC